MRAVRRDDVAARGATFVFEDVHAPLCAPEIVRETCTLLGGARSGSVDDLTLFELAEALAASARSMERFWPMLGNLPLSHSGADGSPQVTCMQLCWAVVGLVGSITTLPPSSDLACYEDRGQLRCDLDVLPATLRKLLPAGSEIPDLHDDKPLANSSEVSWQNPETQITRVNRTERLEVTRLPKEIEYQPQQAMLRVSNLFRIYPSTNTSIRVSMPTMDDTAMLRSLLGLSLLENNSAQASTDSSWQSFLQSVIDGFKRITRAFSSLFSSSKASTTATSTTTTSRAWTTMPPAGSSSCNLTACRSFPTDCATKPSSCSRCTQCMASTTQSPVPATTSAGSSTSDWRTEVQMRNQEAQAYVNTAVRKFKLAQTQSLVYKWFGAQATSDATYKAEINRVLNSVAEMLGNVEYVYPGSQCSANTYAYVFPYGPQSKNADGKYIFHLCDVYMASRQAEQIETLTHEGSHHATAYTDDVCADELWGGSSAQYTELALDLFSETPQPGDVYKIGTNMAVVRIVKTSTVMLEFLGAEKCQRKAYGRDVCARIAARDTIKALRNADNVCYYIQDVTDSP